VKVAREAHASVENHARIHHPGVAGRAADVAALEFILAVSRVPGRPAATFAVKRAGGVLAVIPPVAEKEALAGVDLVIDTRGQARPLAPVDLRIFKIRE